MLRIRIPVRTGKKGLVTITQSVLPALPLLPSALAPLLPSALAPLLPSALAPLLPPTPAPSLDQKLAAEMEAIHHLIQSDVGRNVVDVVRMEIAKNSKKHNTRLHCDKIRELIASGANIELKGFSEYTPLCLAVFVADDELVQFLLGRGANIDAVVHEGQTVLHLAIVGRNVNVAAAVVREILKNPERVQEKINRKNIYGEAPLSYAIALGFERSFIQMIILAGADCNAARNDGKTVLDLLAHVRDREVVSVITDAISRQTQPENFVKNTLDMALHLFGMRQISSAEVGSEMADWLVNFAKEKVLEVAKENSKNPQLIADYWLQVAYNLIAKQFEEKLVGEARERNLYTINSAMSLFVEMLKSGANPNSRTLQGYTGLHIAAWIKSQLLWRDLIELGTQEFENEFKEKPGVYWLDGRVVPVLHNTLILPRPQKKSAEPVKQEVKKQKEDYPPLPPIKSAAELWQEYLNNLPRDQANLTDRLVGNDVNVTRRDGISVLGCAVRWCGNEVIQTVLQRDDLKTATVISELKSVISKNDKQHAKFLLGNEYVIGRVASLEKKERDALLKELRDSNRDKEIKVKFNDFAAAINPVVTASAVSALEPQKLSKNQIQKLKREQREAKEEEERREKEEREAMQRGVKMVGDDLLNEVLLTFVTDAANAAKPKLSATASKFVPAATGQMQQFLVGMRDIKSVADLPEFLQPTITKLPREGSVVLLKGSAVYQRDTSRRVPSDLDLEILVEGIAEWNLQRLQNFCRENFGLDVDPTQVYRTDSVFSLNIKDKAKNLDISIYDRAKTPPEYLSWTTNREEKIFFNHNGVARRVLPAGVHKSDDLVVNYNAHGLLMRLCFLEVIGVVAPEELRQVVKNIPYDNPTNLLFYELRLDKLEAGRSQDEQIRKKISDFVESHKLDSELRKKFLQNLYDILPQHSSSLHSQIYTTISDMIQTPATTISTSHCLSQALSNHGSSAGLGKDFH